jgi:hypothetical protein
MVPVMVALAATTTWTLTATASPIQKTVALALRACPSMRVARIRMATVSPTIGICVPRSQVSLRALGVLPAALMEMATASPTTPIPAPKKPVRPRMAAAHLLKKMMMAERFSPVRTRSSGQVPWKNCRFPSSSRRSVSR